MPSASTGARQRDQRAARRRAVAPDAEQRVEHAVGEPQHQQQHAEQRRGRRRACRRRTWAGARTAAAPPSPAASPNRPYAAMPASRGAAGGFAADRSEPAGAAAGDDAAAPAAARGAGPAGCASLTGRLRRAACGGNRRATSSGRARCRRTPARTRGSTISPISLPLTKNCTSPGGVSTPVMRSPLATSGKMRFIASPQRARCSAVPRPSFSISSDTALGDARAFETAVVVQVERERLVERPAACRCSRTSRRRPRGRRTRSSPPPCARSSGATSGPTPAAAARRRWRRRRSSS